MSRVIRGGGEGPRVVPSEVYDAREEAARIVEEARRAAGALVEEARREADAIRAQARAAGEEEGRARAAADLLRAAEVRDETLRRAERDVVALALAAAKRIVGDELALAPDRVGRIVGEVLDRARRAQRVVVRVAPEDAEAVRRTIETRGATAVVEADASIARGGCVVSTDLGELDARIEVKLAALERALLGEDR